MATTTSLLTGMSGILAHGRMLEVTGNNIANTNTVAFKSSRTNFSTMFARTLSGGSGPNPPASGGSNPMQVGLGVRVASIQRDFTSGAIANTGVSTDLAIDGDGFFIVGPDSDRRYTRDGSFRLDALNNLVTASGLPVYGYGVNSDFSIAAGSMTPLSIPQGVLTVAEATESVNLEGNLNAAGDVATLGSLTTFGALTVLGSAPPPTNPPYADNNTLLTNLDNGSGAPLFAAGESIRLDGAEKGGRLLEPAELLISAATTMADFLAFLEESLGIDTSVSGDPGGVSIDPATGVISVTGNFGEDNTLNIDTEDLQTLDADGNAADQPFTTEQQNAATGESARTTMQVYDSLGNALLMDLTFVLVETSDLGTTWRYYASSDDDATGDPRLGTGLVQFSTTGQLTSPLSFDLSLSREDSGAESPLTVTFNLEGPTGSVTAYADSDSEIRGFGDGTPLGTLAAFDVGADGMINGIFDNGAVRNLGQIMLATFTNPDGLTQLADNTFVSGVNSGSAAIAAPQSFGSGRIQSASLEQSNVDLSGEFVDMILASTGYSASSRIISTANELIQQLLLIGR